MKPIILLTASLMAAAAFIDPSSSLQTTRTTFAAVQPTPVERPPFSGYKGVTLGTPAAEARQLLGLPKETSDAMDVFEVSERLSVQVYYDSATHSVRALTLLYSGDLDRVPTPKDIFGEDAEFNSDGGIFKKVDYPKEGFWITYHRTPGDGPVVLIAINKM